jgi:phage terminase Nu1 subunit (DNA packaging protein)
MQAVNQSEFARLMGFDRSYVTKLKKGGRLVLDDRGHVLVEASKKRIDETADPNRDDVKTRWKNERGNESPPEKQQDSIGNSYQAARAVKERYQALHAKLEYEEASGLLIKKVDVDAAVADVVTMFRQAMEQIPHRTGPELVGKDLDAIRATLKQDVHAALSDMEREFNVRLERISKANQ